MSRKSKIQTEAKLQAVEACITGELSQSEVARRLQVDKSSVGAWIRKYKSEGAAGLESTEQNRIYPAWLKQQAVKAYLAGKGFTNRMSGGSRMKSTHKTTQEERIQIAKECIENENNYGLIATKHGVSYQQGY